MGCWLRSRLEWVTESVILGLLLSQARQIYAGTRAAHMLFCVYHLGIRQGPSTVFKLNTATFTAFTESELMNFIFFCIRTSKYTLLHLLMTRKFKSFMLLASFIPDIRQWPFVRQ